MKQVNSSKNLKKTDKKDAGRIAPKTRGLFLYGKHACLAALSNGRRKIINIYITKNFDQAELPSIPGVRPQLITNEEVGRFIPDGSVHQGIIIETTPLADPGLAYVEKKGGIIIILDQVTDPQNVGAILRTATAFNVTAIIIPKDNAPEESSALAKAASGALEIVPIIRVTNLVRAIEELKKHGYWFIGMDGNTQTEIGSIKDVARNTALVMGAEGKGLRRLTLEACDFIVKIPISKQIESLNVSNAAAIGLYCLNDKINKILL